MDVEDGVAWRGGAAVLTPPIPPDDDFGVLANQRKHIFLGVSPFSSSTTLAISKIIFYSS